MKPPLVDGKEELGVEKSGFLKLPQFVGCPAEPVDVLHLWFRLECWFPLQACTRPVHCGIAMDTPPRSPSVDFPSQPNWSVPWLSIPVEEIARGGTCLHWPGHLGEVSFLCVSVRGGFVQPGEKKV